MKFTNILSACLTGAALVWADATAVNNQLSVIATYTALLNSDAQQFNSVVTSLPFALQVQQDAVLLYRQVNIGTSLSQSSANFGEPGSLQVSATLVNLSNQVQNALSTISSKASTFGELGPIVLASLYSLKNSTDVFADATIAKLALIEAAAAPIVKQNLDNAFNSAIQAYGGKREPFPSDLLFYIC